MAVQARAVLAHIVEVVRMAAAATIAIALAELLRAPLVQTKRAASADQNLQASMVTAAVATFAVALAELTVAVPR